MNKSGRIVRVSPPAGIPGGEVVIHFDNSGASELRSCNAWFGDVAGHIVGISSNRVLVLIPNTPFEKVQLALEFDGERTEPVPFLAGSRLADNLHPVANPAFEPGSGALFVTR